MALNVSFKFNDPALENGSVQLNSEKNTVEDFKAAIDWRLGGKKEIVAVMKEKNQLHDTKRLNDNEQVQVFTRPKTLAERREHYWKTVDRLPTSIKHNNGEGLPEHHSPREKKVNTLANMRAEKRCVLVTAPPQSGKTSLAQLFVKHAKKQKQKVFYISFRKLTDRSEAGLNKYFKMYTEPSISLDDFDLLIASDPGCIVVLDEAQMVFHVHRFWRCFKAGQNGFCSVLAFAAFALPLRSHSLPDKPSLFQKFMASLFLNAPKQQLLDKSSFLGSTPSMFDRDNTLSYEFVAFDNEEFDQVVRKFKESLEKSGKNDPFSESVINEFKSKVCSLHSSAGIDSKQPPATYLAAERVHPGLTYAFLEKLKSEPADQVAKIVLFKHTLYKKLGQEMRCFANFDDLETIFKHVYQKKLAAVTGFGEATPTKENKMATSFIECFSELLRPLASGLCIKLDLVEDTFRQLLVRYALCYYNEATPTDIYVSCPLVQTHLLTQLYRRKWKEEKARKLPYKPKNIGQFVFDSFVRFRPAEMQRQLQNYKNTGITQLCELVFSNEFAEAAKPITNHVLDLELPVLKRSSATPGDNPSISIFVNSDLGWAIVMTRNGSLLHDLTTRFEKGGKYHGHFKEFILVDCYQDQEPSIDKYLKDGVSAQQAKNWLIVVFSNNFRRVDFYRPNMVERRFDAAFGTFKWPDPEPEGDPNDKAN